MPIGFNHNTFNINAQEESTLEIGSIYSSARSSAPSGYLLCDGSAVNRTTYANLFSAIGTSFGTGDGSTTFNIPDGRGGVLRGTGTSSGYSQNVTVTMGTKTNDAVQDHSHSVSYDVATTAPYVGFTGGPSPVSASYSGYVTVGGMNSGRSANETRMKNLGVNFFIKF